MRESSRRQSDLRPLNVMVVIFSLSIGGAERLIVDWAISCKQTQKVEPVIVVVNRDYDENLVAMLRASGITLYLLNRRPGSKSIVPFARMIQLLYGIRPKVVHAHNYSSFKVASLLKVFLPTARLFTTVHTTGLAQTFSRIDLGLSRLFGTRFIAISEAVAQDCRAAQLKRVEVIYNGVNLERFRKVSRSRTFGSRVKLINVARLNRKQKGQDLLLQAVKECADSGLDVSCVFAGGQSSGCDEERCYLEQMAADLGVSSRVTFCLDRVDVDRMLYDADIFVLPSRKEGFGLAVVEAMAAGLPVVVSDVGGLQEIVTDRETGYLVPPENSRALAQKIAEVSKDSNLGKICAAAVTRANAFGIGYMCDRYHQAYLEAL